MSQPHKPAPNPSGKPAYAAVDLGTNNCRMLVAEPNDGGFRVVDSFSRIVRLGEGVAASGTLSEAAIGRTLSALKICRSKLRSRNVKRVRCITTEACRRAGNQNHFLERVRSEVGLELEAISADEEAALTIQGCRPLLRRSQHPRALVFDIGGGSTEAMWIDMEDPDNPKPIDVISLAHGVVTLSEQFAKKNNSSNETYLNIIDIIDQEIAVFDDKHAIAQAIADGQVQMLGTSGTVTTLGALNLGMARYDRSKVDGIELSFDDIRTVIDLLAAMSLQDRMDHPCIGPRRADLIMTGCAILDAVCARWPVGRLTVADRGIREGILMSLIDADTKDAKVGLS